MPHPSLDEIYTYGKERRALDRLHGVTREEVEAIKAEDWKPPHDVEFFPIIEKAAPLDWFIRGEIERASAAGDLPFASAPTEQDD